MCGIAGMIGDALDFSLIQYLSDAQLHRGPDNQQVYQDKHICFAHQRLSIIDLSERGNQPMVKSGLVIVFNGEVYNYKELRQELAKEVEFETESDTEVVLESWRQWGKNCLTRLRGMFAFAIHDLNDRQTYIARDPYGIKPLFYMHTVDGLVFSSELKSLEKAFRDKLPIDESALAASLLYVWVPETSCIWQGIKKLLPGHYLAVDADGKVTIDAYYRLIDSISSNCKIITSEAEAVECVEQTLLDSVNAHLIADVPINAFLSGGVDSSLLVSMAKQQLDSLDCFTIKFSDDAKKLESMSDDAHYASVVAKKLGVSLNTINASPDMVDLLPKVVSYLDEPIGDSAAINTYLISKAAHDQGVKVLLSGMGADELFGGYRRHQANLIANRYRKIPGLIRSSIEKTVSMLPVRFAGRGIVPVRWAKRFVSFAGLPPADAYFRSYTYYDQSEMQALMPGEGANHFEMLRSRHNTLFDIPKEAALIDRMSFTDVHMFMVSLNETYTDRASMAASTEVRVPFIDKEVVNIAFRLSPDLKIKGGCSKYVLKKVAERWLDKDIVYRKKASFTLPLRAWISGQLADMVDDYVLSSGGLSGREWFSSSELRKIVKNDRAGVKDNAQHIWQLLTLEQWFRNHGI